MFFGEVRQRCKCYRKGEGGIVNLASEPPVNIESSSQPQMICLKRTDVLVFRALWQSAWMADFLWKTHIQFMLGILPLTIHWAYATLKHKFHTNS